MQRETSEKCGDQSVGDIGGVWGSLRGGGGTRGGGKGGGGGVRGGGGGTSEACMLRESVAEDVNSSY